MIADTKHQESEIYSDCRHYVAYSGVKLPLKLVNQLQDSDMHNRNTFFRGLYNDSDQLVICQKMVYGEVEFEHRYEYHENGMLKTAVIQEADEEPRILSYDEKGNIIR